MKRTANIHEFTGPGHILLPRSRQQSESFQLLTTKRRQQRPLPVDHFEMQPPLYQNGTCSYESPDTVQTQSSPFANCMLHLHDRASTGDTYQQHGQNTLSMSGNETAAALSLSRQQSTLYHPASTVFAEKLSGELRNPYNAAFTALYTRQYHTMLHTFSPFFAQEQAQQPQVYTDASGNFYWAMQVTCALATQYQNHYDHNLYSPEDRSFPPDQHGLSLSQLLPA